MKKLVLLFCALLSLSTQASELSNEALSRRENFKKIKDKNWEHATTIKKQWETLQHNPQITLFEKNDHKLVPQSGPTLFVHGWGDSKDSLKTYKRSQSNHILPGDTITFNFPDASCWFAHTIPYKMPLSKSSFAGDPDIATLLCVLKTLHLAESLPAVLYPHSRGAGTACKVIGILNNPTDDDRNRFLTPWDISEDQRQSIIGSFRVIYIIDPLTNFDIALHQQIRTKLMIMDWLFPSLIEHGITPCVKTLLPYVTQYNPTTYKNAIDYIEQWEGINAHVWLHFEENDEAVGNKDNVECAQKFLEAIPENLYVSRTDNGGHKAYEIFISTIVQAFNKRAECSHLIDDLYHDERAQTSIADARITDETATQTHLTKFSLKHTAKPTFWQHRITKRLLTVSALSLLGFLLYKLNASDYGICGIKFGMDATYPCI